MRVVSIIIGGLGSHVQSTEPNKFEQEATQAGLTYVSDGVPGISRRRVGKGWAFYDPAGALIKSKAERKRILSLAIPPAWTDVWVCPDPDGHIQVTARDAKGRKQYRYHARYREARDASKFRRIFEFSEALPAIRGRIEKDLRGRSLSHEQVLATATHLLDTTLIRVGNEEYAKGNRSYGLTTLRDEHVQIEGSDVNFSFRGKSGVEHALSVRDKRIARIIQQCRDLPGEELFQYLDAEGRQIAITSDDVNKYLELISGSHVTAKDFRTWGGTMLAGQRLRELGPAETERTIATNINVAVDAVAERLGNTRAVCKQYYIHPVLIDAYRQGLVAAAPIAQPETTDRRKHRGAALRRDEIAILQFVSQLV